MPVLTGLGCCYKCQFCINVILNRRYRYRTATSIIEEIKKLREKYGANTFIFYDEDFFINKKRLLEFLDLVEKENLRFSWRAWARVDYFNNKYLNRDLILRLEKCGLRSIVMGGESGSQKVLDIIKKGIKVENILHSAKMLDGTMITPRYSFIVGLEGEGKDDTKKTYKLCADLINVNEKVDIAGPFIFRYYPGSPIFDSIIKNFNIEIPQKVEDWGNYLSGEGYLKVDKMPWVWHGCIKTATILNREMLVFAILRDIDNSISKLVKKVIMWRIRNLYIKVPVELYAYDLMKWSYHRYLKIVSNN
jgi:anaerobic magnesium-protoporphyrin IX monomethyl ester cyclase